MIHINPAEGPILKAQLERMIRISKDGDARHTLPEAYHDFKARINHASEEEIEEAKLFLIDHTEGILDLHSLMECMESA